MIVKPSACVQKILLNKYKAFGSCLGKKEVKVGRGEMGITFTRKFLSTTCTKFLFWGETEQKDIFYRKKLTKCRIWWDPLC